MAGKYDELNEKVAGNILAEAAEEDDQEDEVADESDEGDEGDEGEYEGQCLHSLVPGHRPF